MRVSAHVPTITSGDSSAAAIDVSRIDSYVTTRLDDGVKCLTIRDELAFLRQTLKLARRQGKYPYAIDDVIWPGTFTVDAGALTLVTLFTK